MTMFCHFHTLIYHKKPYNAVILARGISAATQRPKVLDFENLVHDFSEGVRISVQILGATVITIRRTPICRQGVCRGGILKHLVFNILYFRGWIKHIFDAVD